MFAKPTGSEFNAKFAVAAAEKGTAFRRCMRSDLDWIFTIQTERTVAKDNTGWLYNSGRFPVRLYARYMQVLPYYSYHPPALWSDMIHGTGRRAFGPWALVSSVSRWRGVSINRYSCGYVEN